MHRNSRNWLCSLQGTATRPTPGALRVWPCSQRAAPSSTGAPSRAAPTIPPSTLCRPHASRSQPRGRAPFQRYAWVLAHELGTCSTLKGHARTCATWHNASRLDLKLADTANILASKEHWVHPHRQPTAGSLLHTRSNECFLRLTQSLQPCLTLRSPTTLWVCPYTCHQKLPQRTKTQQWHVLVCDNASFCRSQELCWWRCSLGVSPLRRQSALLSGLSTQTFN